ncbi:MULTISPECIES: ParB/RepB/Spo0J family partition protein [Streptomyces]|uniref:ParB-like N-terminal domain-containing protein n=1 Tax=Streptomyces mordarskii TaxID=1226758 RepID=A0ABN1DXQ7_9ACTN
MGRRTSLASLAGGQVEDVPGQNDVVLLRIPLTQLVPTRFNPRRNFGTEEQLREFGLILQKRQLQPAVVVSRTAYLKLWPEEAENVGSVPYVIANGERRYRASRAAGLTHLDIVHREEVARSRADFLDAVMSENNDREDLDPIERALGIDTMVKQVGGTQAVADYYDKTKGWVSHQRKLLKLTDELQQLVSTGEMPIRSARDIAGLPQSEQAAAWASEVKQRQAARAAPRQRVKPVEQPPEPEPQPDPVPVQRSVFTAVNSPTPNEVPSPAAADSQPSPPVSSPKPFTAVNGSAAAPAPAVPAEESPVAVVMPWGDRSAVLRILREFMEPAELEQLAKEVLG